MAPLILHNVPDEELYIGDDGIKRPYAMVFPHQETQHGSQRNRRGVTEKGSFGKSMRRSRSRTGTPAKKEDPTVRNADEIFGRWKASQAADTAGQSPIDAEATDDAPAPALSQTLRREPTEVILRGYRAPTQQYAAIQRYEQIAGRICEDYSREPPATARRYKLDLHAAMLADRGPLTPEERAKVNRGDGGEHWVKVTFESAQAADTALYNSPQNVQGHLVYAELYRGIPPPRDEPIPDPVTSADGIFSAALGQNSLRQRRGAEENGIFNTSPSQSHTSTRTISTGTVNGTASTDTLTSPTTPGRTTTAPGTPWQTPGGTAVDGDDEFCRGRIRARKMRLQNADLALLPQTSLAQRVTAAVPFLKWFTGSMIGSEVPRTDAGEFDWDRASLYWKVIWWMDKTFGLCGGEILNGVDKDD